jgi:hypothetical protein
MQRERTLLMTGMFLTSLVGGAIGGILVDSQVLVAGTAQLATVTTTQVNVVDADNRLRAVLSGQDERNMASLAFYDPDGQVRAIVGLDANGVPLVNLLNRTGENRLRASVLGEDAVVVVGSDATRSGTFGVLGGVPVLSLDDGRQSRVRVQVNQDGSSSLGLFDGRGAQSVVVSVDAATGLPLMSFHEEGSTRLALGVLEQAAVLNLYDAEQPRLVIGVAQDGHPSMSFLGENGQVVQELPLAEFLRP